MSGLSDDESWVLRMRRGDVAAFDEAYARHHSAVYNFLARLIGRRDLSLAEDLAQETWVRLATHAADLRADTHLLPWLFTVARNLSVSFLRWRVRDRERLGVLRLVASSPSETPFDRAAALELGRRAETALARLPLRHREPLLLCGVHGLSPQDAASVLNINADTLRQRLARARAAFQTALELEDRATKKKEVGGA